jgi:hypothetical protein
MINGKEVKISIDDSFTGPVCDYSVGFLKFHRQGNDEVGVPAGTGTFVKLGRVYGILTAGHVLKELATNETVGLVRFPSVQPPIQNARLELQHTDRIVDWNGKNCSAPDIAFLKIPELEGRKLEAEGASFYNLAIERKFSVSSADHHMSQCYAVVGVVGEWTEPEFGEPKRGHKVTLGGLFGAATNLKPFKEDGVDLVDVDIDHVSGPHIPKSYGGVSGGALWELHVELDANHKIVKVNKRLHAVAFREVADQKRITSNSAPSIEAMVARIREKWPDETSAG